MKKKATEKYWNKIKKICPYAKVMSKQELKGLSEI